MQIEECRWKEGHANKPLKHSQHYQDHRQKEMLESCVVLRNPIYHLKSSIWAIHPVQCPSTLSVTVSLYPVVVGVKNSMKESAISVPLNWIPGYNQIGFYRTHFYFYFISAILLLLFLLWLWWLDLCFANLQFACQRTTDFGWVRVSLFTARLMGAGYFLSQPF